MNRFFIDHDKLNKDKANDIYLDCCKELIEQNGLKSNAKNIALKLIDKLIEDEKQKDKLTSLYWTCKQVKKQIEQI